MTRVPFAVKRKNNSINKPQNAPKEAVTCSSGLNSESGATSSVSCTTPIQTTTRLMPQAASDLPQPVLSESASSRPVQTTPGLTDTMSHSSCSSTSRNFAPLQITRSNTAQDVVVLVGQHVPQTMSLQPSQSLQVVRSLSDSLQSTSLPQSNSSVPGQTVLNIVSSNRPQHSIVMPQVVLPQSQSAVVLATGAPSGLATCPSVTQPSAASVQKATIQSVYLNNLNNTQSRFIANKLSVPSFPTLSNPQSSTSNSSSSHSLAVPQAVPQTVSQSVPQAVPQAVHQAVSCQSSTSQIDPTSILHPYSQAVSNTQSVKLLSFQSASTQASHLQYNILNVASSSSVNSGPAWKFYRYTPVLAVNNSTTLTRLPPNKKKSVCMTDKKSSHPISANVSFPQPLSLNVPPVSSDKELDASVSNAPPLTAGPISSEFSNMGQIDCATQTIRMPIGDIPVKAPSDSVCEGAMSVWSRTSPVAEADINLPTLTMPEKNTKFKELTPVQQPRDPHAKTVVEDCPPNLSFFSRSELPLKRISMLSASGSSSTNHWLKDLPSSFRDILCSDRKMPAEDACSRSALELASLPNAKVINTMKLLNLAAYTIDLFN